MTQDSLTQQDDDIIQIDDNKDYFTDLVGEGKKYKDEKALAKATAHAQSHIKLLETQMADLREDYLKQREELNAGARLQEVLDKLDTVTQQQLTSREMNPNSNEALKPSLGLADVDSLVSQKIHQHESARAEANNFKSVEAKAKEMLGNNFKNILKEKAQGLGMSDQEVVDMARKNPNLFFKTFDLLPSQRETFQAPPKSGSTFTPVAPKKNLKWSDYLEMKKKNPKAWLENSQIRIQMERDAQALGKDFYDV